MNKRGAVGCGYKKSVGLRPSDVIMQLAPGSIFDSKFQIVAEIGSGGMGSVYQAYQRDMDRYVALKILERTPLTQDDCARLEREAALLSDIRHRGIGAVYGCGVRPDCLYLVLEFVEGKTLRSLLNGGRPLDVTRGLAIIEQLCDALACVHKRGIIHRDIKPENIIISNGGDAKLIDLGLAKTIRRDRTLPTLTDIDMVVGTPLYMSPEQCVGGKVDHRSDIYALGVVLYECLCGKPPFNAGATHEVMFAQVNSEPPQLQLALPNGDLAAINGVVNKCLAKQPENRYQSAEDLKTDLDLVKTGAQSKLRLPSNRRKTSLKRAGALAAGIVCGLFFCIMLFQSQTASKMDSIGSKTKTNNLQKYRELYRTLHKFSGREDERLALCKQLEDILLLDSRVQFIPQPERYTGYQLAFNVYRSDMFLDNVANLGKLAFDSGFVYDSESRDDRAADMYGFANWKAGKPQQTIDLFDKDKGQIKFDWRKSSWAHWHQVHLINSFLMCNDPDKALAELAIMRTLCDKESCGELDYYELMALSLAKKGRMPEAVKYLEQAIAAKDHAHEFQLTELAQACIDLNRWQDADAVMTYRQDRYPESTNPTSIRITAELYIHNEKYSDARDLMDTLLGSQSAYSAWWVNDEVHRYCDYLRSVGKANLADEILMDLEKKKPGIHIPSSVEAAAAKVR